ncbi:hypothetical protein [Natrinema soli]|uniref:Uncharacterized protein n=1 Tax=Natrinema soli TaxID=1930624 RepID=A0ABD5SLI5_9EURY|nr:hypothetical protein [Natrinema soli]
MAEEGRALMTEREREIIAGDADVTSNYRYKVQSLVRNRVRKQFGDDVEVLEESFSEVYEMLVDDVCDRAGGDLETVAKELDEIEAAFERGDPDAARSALERAQETISKRDRDER